MRYTDWPLEASVVWDGSAFVLSPWDEVDYAAKMADPDQQTALPVAFDARAKSLIRGGKIEIPANGRAASPVTYANPSQNTWPNDKGWLIEGDFYLVSVAPGSTVVKAYLDAVETNSFSPASWVANPNLAEGGYLEHYSFGPLPIDLAAGGLLSLALDAGSIKRAYGTVWLNWVEPE